MKKVAPIVGQRVKLLPLERKHFDEIIPLALESELWEHNSRKIETERDVLVYLEEAFETSKHDSTIAFVTMIADSQQIVGMTRFGNIVEGHKRLEIGWTWIAKAWRRSFVNTEAKYLMLKYAFEELRFNRVELKTDTRNMRSRKAMERLGAKQEGILRKHMLVPKNGDTRDTVYYSVISEEWPDVKANLQRLMDK